MPNWPSAVAAHRRLAYRIISKLFAKYIAPNHMKEMYGAAPKLYLNSLCVSHSQCVMIVIVCVS